MKSFLSLRPVVLHRLHSLAKKLLPNLARKYIVPMTYLVKNEQDKWVYNTTHVVAHKLTNKKSLVNAFRPSLGTEDKIPEVTFANPTQPDHDPFGVGIVCDNTHYQIFRSSALPNFLMITSLSKIP